jgi:multidrug resistance efflux pump
MTDYKERIAALEAELREADRRLAEAEERVREAEALAEQSRRLAGLDKPRLYDRRDQLRDPKFFQEHRDDIMRAAAEGRVVGRGAAEPNPAAVEARRRVREQLRQQGMQLQESHIDREVTK